MSTFVPASTIDEVISRLEVIYDESLAAKSPYGIFPTLYLVVTLCIRDGIRNGDFEDNARMEKLDVHFANRFLEARHKFINGDKEMQSWDIAFIKTGRFRGHLVLQVLLLNINAHINLDLGMAAAATAPGDAYDSLKNDFNAINDVLFDLMDDVKADLSRFSPRIRSMLRYLKGKDDAILSFSLKKARNQAWKFGKELSKAKPEDIPGIVAKKDEKIYRLGRIISYPSIIGKIFVWWIKWKESKYLELILKSLRNDYPAKMRSRRP